MTSSSSSSFSAFSDDSYGFISPNDDSASDDESASSVAKSSANADTELSQFAEQAEDLDEREAMPRAAAQAEARADRALKEEREACASGEAISKKQAAQQSAVADELRAALTKAYIERDEAEQRVAEVTADTAANRAPTKTMYAANTILDDKGDADAETGAHNTECSGGGDLIDAATVKARVNAAVAAAAAEATVEATGERKELLRRIATLDEEVTNLRAANNAAAGEPVAARTVAIMSVDANASTANANTSSTGNAEQFAALERQLLAMAVDLTRSMQECTVLAAKLVSAEAAAQEADEATDLAASRAVAAEAHAASAEEGLVKVAKEAVAGVATGAAAAKASSDLGHEVRGLKRTISLAEKQCQLSIDQRMFESRDKHAGATTALTVKLAQAKTQLASFEHAKEKLEGRLNTVNDKLAKLLEKHLTETQDLRARVGRSESKLQSTQEGLDRARTEQATAESATEAAWNEGNEKATAAELAAESRHEEVLQAHHFEHKLRVEAAIEAAEVRNVQTASDRDRPMAAEAAARDRADTDEQQRDEAAEAAKGVEAVAVAVMKERNDAVEVATLARRQLAGMLKDRDTAWREADEAALTAHEAVSKSRVDSEAEAECSGAKANAEKQRDGAVKALAEAEAAAAAANALHSSAVSSARAAAAATATREALRDATTERIALGERLASADTALTKLQSDLAVARETAELHDEAAAASAWVNGAEAEVRSAVHTVRLKTAEELEKTASTVAAVAKGDRDGLKRKLDDAEASRKALQNDKYNLLRMLNSLESENINLAHQLEQDSQNQQLGAEAAVASAAHYDITTATLAEADISAAAMAAEAEIAAAVTIGAQVEVVRVGVELEAEKGRVAVLEARLTSAADNAAEAAATTAALAEAAAESADHATVTATASTAAAKAVKVVAEVEAEVTRLRGELDVEKARCGLLEVRLVAAEDLRSAADTAAVGEAGSVAPASVAAPASDSGSSSAATGATAAAADGLCATLADKSRLLSVGLGSYAVLRPGLSSDGTW
jgi:hypothetical protein